MTSYYHLDNPMTSSITEKINNDTNAPIDKSIASKSHQHDTYKVEPFNFQLMQYRSELRNLMKLLNLNKVNISFNIR